MLSSFKSFENISNLGKQSCNTIKTLSVVDRNGRFRFVHTGTHGGVNDRDQFTSSCLYTSQADYFTDEQFVVADGIYRGDGKTMVSYTAIELKRDPDGSRANFNTSFTEFRKGVENSFGRVQMWFPILGNSKAKWNYDPVLLGYAVHACTRLHNWMMHERNLNYDPTTDPKYHFTAAWLTKKN